MNLYRFRKLETVKDFKRIKDCLNTGEFHCSEFSELNDPMEGVFTTSEEATLKEALDVKRKYKICSFSSQEGFKNPCMWGYYANAFKGVAIEIEVNLSRTDDEKIYELSYEDELPNISKTDKVSVERVLTRKRESWRHESEWRFLIQSKEPKHKIGEIKAVYFGDPYGGLSNRKELVEKSAKKEEFEEYFHRSEKLISWLGKEKSEIEIFVVKVEKGKVAPHKI